MSDDIRYLFEDPDCGKPDESHPDMHAALNIGRCLAFIAEQTLFANGFARGDSIPERNIHETNGLTSFTLLEAARQDPEWADALLGAMRDDRLVAVKHNAKLLREALPLSPLDKAIAEGTKS